ncbi:DNA replication licensing factor MCM3 isoform X2 [Centruroides vittatus]|uniref:DNA replication licensing factor MCM3 isoform X2 n=1 Tax=Centruroides vittatus TaxID=120091 RepID=UPI0035108170
MALDVDQRIRDIQREYLDFLDDDVDQGYYSQCVKDMITNNGCRLIVNINDLRKKNPKRAQELLENSFEELVAFQRALKELISGVDTTYAKQFEEFYIGLEGSFGSRHVTPRTLHARQLGSIVCVEGIVTKCSLVRPKVVRSVHYCPATNKTLERRYTDLTSYEAFPSSSVYLTKDEDGNVLETEYGLCTYKDHQTFSIQEMPEKAPAGQLPRNVDVIADGDLVDNCKPGDRIQVIGTYRCLPGKKGGFSTGTFRTVLIANNIKQISKELSPAIYAEDVKKCKQFNKRHKQDIFDILASSLAPSIHGHEFIKKALLCMLLGGVEKTLPNGTRLRGDINILLIGDPSVAKSQLLRYVLHTAARAISTTGRGSSGVGLTAAVTTDHETGDRRLEAGAMVLADKGVVCIDEFDKMSDIDRTAIHEVMEQGRVTIAKAGIHAKLNARCSVLAAANPVYGKYDQYKTPMENIGLQDSLLSRFDLLFIILDKMDPEKDREIADHVVRMHRYRAPGEMDGEPLPINSTADFLTTRNPDEEDKATVSLYEKYDALLHGSRSKSDKILSVQFMRKYTYIARCLKPKLTQEACDCIAEEYAHLRTMETEHTDLARTQPITARTLETLIRLSTAHAKARLSKSVELEDAQAAIELVQYAYFKKVIEKPKKRQRRDSSEEEMEESEEHTRKKTRTSDAGEQKTDSTDPYDFQAEDSNDIPPMRKDKSEVPKTPSVEVPIARLKTFRSLLFKLFTKEHAQSVAVSAVIDFITKESPEELFTPEEIMAALNKMMDSNQVMVAENTVFLI